MQQDDTRFLELLDRWAQGDFTRADERSLHELTATDAFRREAWEGLLEAPEADHAARLAALRTRLLTRMPGGRRIAWPRVLTAAAAVAALVIAVVVFFPRWNEPDVSGPLATTQSEQAPVNPELPNDVPEAEAPPAAPGAGAPVANDALASRRSTAAEPAAKQENARSEGLDDALVLSEEKFEYRPESVPTPIAPADKTLAQPKPQADLPAVATSPAPTGSAGKEAAKKAKSMPAPASRSDSLHWSNTDDRPDVAAMKKDARKEALSGPTFPKGGWDAFAEYLRQNARLTPEARNNNITGSVRLQFNVNDRGEPQNFRILRSLGFGCDQEAIRLVEQYDNWAPGWEPVTVDVKFVR